MNVKVEVKDDLNVYKNRYSDSVPDEVKMNASDLRWVLSYHKNRLIANRRYLSAYRSAWRQFWGELQKYKAMAPAGTLVRNYDLQPNIFDNTATTEVEPIYYYQDAWAFEHIVKTHPSHHVDVGSHHKFVALLSKVLPVTMVDIRPLSVHLDSLKFKEGSILALPYDSGSLPSISSICVIEHIGLGRYGDPLNPDGTELAARELMRVLEPGGRLYISVPIGDENMTRFNANRVFRDSYVDQLFSPFEIIERRYIFGSEFVDTVRKGEGTGCYVIERPLITAEN